MLGVHDVDVERWHDVCVVCGFFFQAEDGIRDVAVTGVQTCALPIFVDGEEALKNEVVLHDDAGSNVVWSGVFSWGDVDQALAEADHVVKIERLHFHRFASTPLECAGALVEYDRGTQEWTIHCNHQMPG